MYRYTDWKIKDPDKKIKDTDKKIKDSNRKIKDPDRKIKDTSKKTLVRRSRIQVLKVSVYQIWLVFYYYIQKKIGNSWSHFYLRLKLKKFRQ